MKMREKNYKELLIIKKIIICKDNLKSTLLKMSKPFYFIIK